MESVSLFQTTPRLVMGAGAMEYLAREVGALGGRRVLIVAGNHLVKAGETDRMKTALESTVDRVQVFSGVTPDPPIVDAVRAGEAAREAEADLIVAVGGGSVLDVAKVAAVLVTNDAPVEEMLGVNLVEKPGLPTLLIPTTSGTGTEVTTIAILSDEAAKLKRGVVSPRLLPKTAILDPELCVSMPPDVTAYTGVDALCHAVEAYTSRRAMPLTDVLALEAARLIQENLRAACHNGADIEARTRMQRAALLAGMAFGAAGVTAVHAFAYPLGAEYHIPHGIANALMLVPVATFNLAAAPDRFLRLADAMGESLAGTNMMASTRQFLDAARRLIRDLGLPGSLREFGVEEDRIPDLAEAALKVTRLMANNRREIGIEDAERIYREAL